MEEQKTLKQYCKEAKKRLKNGFWQKYHKDLEQVLVRAEEEGISSSVVKEYYAHKVGNDIRRKNDENETFYKKVKKILDEEGEIPNAIGRLTDKKYYNSLTYEEQQRYNLSLSENYLKAVERYNREKSFDTRNNLP